MGEVNPLAYKSEKQLKELLRSALQLAEMYAMSDCFHASKSRMADAKMYAEELARRQDISKGPLSELLRKRKFEWE